MSFVSLNGTSAIAARFYVSAWGAWWADFELAEASDFKGAASVVFADAKASGTIVSGGPYEGKARYRVVGGKGGWGKLLKRKPYANDAGVKAALVIGDAAREVGELVEGAPDTRQGPHFARVEAPASRVLHTLAPQSWRVDFDGVTRFGKRPTVAYTGDGARTETDLAQGVYEIATETIGQLVPGVTIAGSNPASDVEYALEGGRMTVRVYTSARTSRRLAAIARIVEALFPKMKWAGNYEFRVVAQVGERFTLQPVRVASGMPDLDRVPSRGSAGVRAVVTPGELVCVSFADCDPSRPYISAHAEVDDPSWMPLFLKLGEEPTLGVARIGDAVICGPYAGTIVAASTRITAGL